MKAIATRYKMDSTLHTTGDDFIYFHVFFRTESHAEAYMPLMFSLDQLIDFILSREEKSGMYLKQIRSDIKGYGPKHSKVLAILLEEGFDLEPYIFQLAESKDEEEIEDHLEWCDRLKLPENQQAILEQSEEIDKLVNSDFVNRQQARNNFLDEVDQTLHELTLKHFPSLFDMDNKNIEAYKDALVTTTLQFTESIDKILHNIFSSYWEKQYNQRQNKE